MRLRRLAAALTGVVAVVALPGTAHADAAGPTDYRTEITAISPATPSIDLSIEGGDSFVRVVADPGVEVLVLGYDEEPYLMIDADGVVYENTRSFATYYNDTRYGTSDIPTDVDNGAAPEWERVGSGGAWAWHDHRAHWMAADAPVGMQPGDSFPAETIPLVVDGQRVDVEVVSTLMADPSWVPALLGGLLGAVLAAGLVTRRRTAGAALALAGSVTALIVGGTQFLSLPSETGPRPIWWLAPAVATACTALALAWRRSPVVRDGLVVLAAAQLGLWIWVRRLTFSRAVLPTDLPFWLDRAASAAVLAGAALVAGAAVASLGALVRQAPRASSMAASSAS